MTCGSRKTKSWAKFLEANPDNSEVVNFDLSIMVRTYDDGLFLENFKK